MRWAGGVECNLRWADGSDSEMKSQSVYECILPRNTVYAASPLDRPRWISRLDYTRTRFWNGSSGLDVS